MSTEAGAAPRRGRSAWWLIGLALCAVAVAVYQFRGMWRAGGAAAPPAAQTRDAAVLGDAPPDVRIEALGPEWPDPVDSPRNPFRFQPKAAPAPARPAGAVPRPQAPGSGAGGAGAGPGAPAAAQGPSPILLKFIGTIDAPGLGKIAALSDGRFVYHGREGDIIEGRYRIVKIGIESIVMEHADGRGRQTIRLTG